MQKNKDEESNSLILKLDSYKNTYWDFKNKNFNNYRNLAVEKFKTINSALVANEEISVDDDALVAVLYTEPSADLLGKASKIAGA